VPCDIPDCQATVVEEHRSGRAKSGCVSAGCVHVHWEKLLGWNVYLATCLLNDRKAEARAYNLLQL